MSASIFIKHVISNALHCSGLVRWKLNKYSENKYLVLMYHRVLPHGQEIEVVEEGMYVDVDTFEEHIIFLKKYFNIISFDEIHNHFINRGGKPICVLTFDDGWQDFFKNAYPLLKKHGIPATVFLPTEYIGTNKWFWTDRLSHIIRMKESLPNRNEFNNHAKEPIINQIERSRGTIHDKLEKAINYLKPLGDDRIEEVISDLGHRWKVDPKPTDRAFISWDEARIMFETGLVIYGSHTANHRILTQLGDADIYNELMISKKRLHKEGLCKSQFLPFCYPNGNYNGKINDMVINAGYDIAVSTEYGWNPHGEKVFLLRRIGMHQDMTGTEAMLACRITNLI